MICAKTDESWARAQAGLADGGERAALQEHRLACAECGPRLAKLEKTLDALATPLSPPVGMWERIEGRLDEAEPERRSLGWGRAIPIAASIAAVALGLYLILAPEPPATLAAVYEGPVEVTGRDLSFVVEPGARLETSLNDGRREFRPVRGKCRFEAKAGGLTLRFGGTGRLEVARGAVSVEVRNEFEADVDVLEGEASFDGRRIPPGLRVLLEDGRPDGDPLASDEVAAFARRLQDARETGRDFGRAWREIEEAEDGRQIPPPDLLRRYTGAHQAFLEVLDRPPGEGLSRLMRELSLGLLEGVGSVGDVEILRAPVSQAFREARRRGLPLAWLWLGPGELSASDHARARELRASLLREFRELLPRRDWLLLEDFFEEDEDED